MSYDIPPQLEHKEKIMFGLTFEQLGYAAPAFLLVFGIIFKSGLPIEISGSIASLILAVAAFFMFFNGKQRTHHLLRYLKNQKVSASMDILRKILDLKKIEENTIETQKSKLTILEVIPLNFMIRPEDERKGIITGFQKFLNSLDFSVQIHISSSPVSLREHLKTMEEKKSELFDSYCKFLKETMDKGHVKNRRFLIIIKERYDLDIQNRICEDALRALGMKVKKLNEEEILGFLQKYISCSEQEVNLTENEIATDYLYRLLAPKEVMFYPECFQIKDNFYRAITVNGYPHSVEEGFLDKLISSPDDYDISIHVEPFPIDHTMIQLNRELQKQQADLYSDSKKGILNPSLEIKFTSTKQVLEDLQKGRQKLFNVSLYVFCKGKSRKEVALLAQKVKAGLGGLMIQSGEPNFRMIDAFESMLPLAKDGLRIHRNIHTSGLSAFFPFSSPFLDVDAAGTLLGFNRNGIPFVKDIFKLTNANGLVLATSGAGKSYFTKLFLSRQFMNGCDVLVIDPQGEYGGITRQCNGQVITISKDSPSVINPLDLMGHDYVEKRLSLLDLFKIMFGEISEIQKAILDKVIEETYARRDITKDGWENRKPPKMQDLYAVLCEHETKAVAQEKATYLALLNRLKMYTENGVFSFLNRQTNIDFSSRFVCFNIGSMPRQIKPVIMYLVLDYVYMRMKSSRTKKLLVIDEAWSLLQGVEESSYVFEIVKTCRKFNLGLLMITQDVADLLNSRAGQAVLSNSSYTFLLRQKASVMQNMARTFTLSDMEKNYLISASLGEGILILENEHQEVKVIASPEEHVLITTNPNEKAIEIKPEEEDEGPIKLSLRQDVHPEAGLSPAERNFLLNRGYVVGSFHSLKSGKQKNYFVKPRHPEGEHHTYYVDLLFQEVLKHTKKVTKHTADKPDILFVNSKGQEIAIEVETGINAKFPSKKGYHNEKFAKIREQYPERAYIFLHDAKKRNSYLRHKLPLLFRKDIRSFLSTHFPHNSSER